MSTVVTKILCPSHSESTPSFVIYEDGSGHCYGCGYHEGKSNKRAMPTVTAAPYVEDLQSSIRRIQTLPTKEIRSLVLPYDEYAYYLVWPNGDYYKKRLFEADNSGKYKSPSGHTKPPFWAIRRYFNTLLIVEGELNALSYSMTPRSICDIVSPGSATDLKNILKIIPLATLKLYGKVVIVSDIDKAGILGAIECKAALLGVGIESKVKPVERDGNEVLVADGTEGIEKEIKSLVL